MATTARELLALACGEASRVEQPTVEQAEAAITAFGYAARELRWLAMATADRAADSQRWSAVGQLIAACGAATAAWPARPGRLPDLVGAACDVLSTRTGERGEKERWAVTVELSRTTRHCAELALRHRPYVRVPALHWVHAAAAEVERRATQRPPEPGSGIVLDLPVPAPRPVAHPAAVFDAAANLGRALRDERTAGPLSISAALATMAAAEDAARRCVVFASTSGGSNEGVWRYAPDSWRVAYGALVRFQDAGCRRRNADPSETVRVAFGLQRALARIGRDGDVDAQEATALRGVANQLPLLARELNLAARRWAGERTLYARARDLLHTEDMVPAILTDSTVPATAEHLGPVVAAIRTAERLSAALPVELNRTAGQLGHQPQPQLAAAHALQAADRHLDADAKWAARLAARVGEIEIPNSLAL